MSESEEKIQSDIETAKSYSDAITNAIKNADKDMQISYTCETNLSVHLSAIEKINSIEIIGKDLVKIVSKYSKHIHDIAVALDDTDQKAKGRIKNGKKRTRVIC